MSDNLWRASRPDMQSFDAETGWQVSYVYPPFGERIAIAGDDPVGGANAIVETVNGLLKALKAARIYVQDCIENGHDRTMLANLYGARDEIDAAFAGADAAGEKAGITQLREAKELK